MKPFTFVIIASLISSPAFAVENEPPAPSPAPAAVEPTPAPAAADPTPSHASREPTLDRAGTAAEHPRIKEKAHAAGGEETKDKDRKKPEVAQKPAISKQAYARLLAAEIRRRTPKSSNDKTGSIHVAFTVGASGRVVSHKVRNSSNPALEPIVGQILASVHTPPPPGGSFSAIQEFNFH